MLGKAGLKTRQAKEKGIRASEASRVLELLSAILLLMCPISILKVPEIPLVRGGEGKHSSWAFHLFFSKMWWGDAGMFSSLVALWTFRNCWERASM